MYYLKLKIFLIFNLFSLFIISQVNATIKVPFENIIINEKPLIYSEIKFEDIDGNMINLKKYRGQLIILNFWATWCVPCKEEMPLLDDLQVNKNIKKLNIFPINLEGVNSKKVNNFFRELGIKNISTYFDTKLNLVKLFSLRGVPTTIFFNRNGEEFARVIGSADFSDNKFIDWLSKY